MAPVSRGPAGRARDVPPDRLPRGQYDAGGSFPVLSASPTPRADLDAWDFTVPGQVDEVARWSWSQFQELPREDVTTDIHCVTNWSNLDTRWQGVSVDMLLAHVETAWEYVTALSGGG